VEKKYSEHSEIGKKEERVTMLNINIGDPSVKWKKNWLMR